MNSEITAILVQHHRAGNSETDFLDIMKRAKISLGMSRKQIYRLLVREGVLYWTFSVLITLTAGTAITYVCFQSMNYMENSFVDMYTSTASVL